MPIPIGTVEERKTFVSEMLASVKYEYYHLDNTNYTVCIATFADGWSTLGYSVCVSAADYDSKIGDRISAENALAEAKTHYWRTVGYLAHCGIKAA